MSDPLREPVSLSDVDPTWPERYRAAATRIAAALVGLDPTLEHIGSTAVPLRGKPIIDLQVAVRGPDVGRAVEALAGLGYRHHGQAGVPGRAYLTRRPPDGFAVNAHVFAAGDPRLAANRAIRDYLRADPAAARAYVAAKQRALERGHGDLLGYSGAKDACVAATLAAAHDSARRARPER